MTLSRHQRLASRYLGLLIDEATQGRLKIHGFHGAAFGCVARGMEPPRSISSALAVCIEEAAEPVALPGDQGGEGAEQAAEQAGEGGGLPSRLRIAVLRALDTAAEPAGTESPEAQACAVQCAAADVMAALAKALADRRVTPEEVRTLIAPAIARFDGAAASLRVHGGEA